jgi:very-short-patch-repair endonuclease
MPRRVILPPDLVAQPFAVGAALARGIGRDRLDSPDLERPFHGIRAAPGSLMIESYRPRLRPRDRISHTSALSMWGAPLPERVLDVVHVTSPAGGPDAPRARGVVGHQSSVGSAGSHHDFPVSDAASAFLESATLLSLDELVAVGDYLVLDPHVLEPGMPRPLISLEALRSAAAASRGSGVRVARAAALLAREGVESPRETALRLLLHRAGLPEPCCGYELLRGQRRIGWFDLAWPEFRAIAEYDGDGHRTSAYQYDRDIQRFDDAAEIGWTVVRVRKRGILVSPDDTVRRVARALQRGGWSNGRKSG